MEFVRMAGRIWIENWPWYVLAALVGAFLGGLFGLWEVGG